MCQMCFPLLNTQAKKFSTAVHIWFALPRLIPMSVVCLREWVASFGHESNRNHMDLNLENIKAKAMASFCLPRSKPWLKHGDEVTLLPTDYVLWCQLLRDTAMVLFESSRYPAVLIGLFRAVSGNHRCPASIASMRYQFDDGELSIKVKY